MTETMHNTYIPPRSSSYSCAVQTEKKPYQERSNDGHTNKCTSTYSAQYL